MNLLIRTENKIKNIIFLIKLTFLFFSTICIFISKYFINPNILIYNILHLVCFALIILMLLYIVLRYNNKINLFNKNSTFFTFCEDIMFFLIYILTLVNSAGNDSNFKLLFLLIIMTCSIEFRMKTSFFYSFLATIMLFSIDFWYGINDPLHIYLEKELFISFYFFIISITIGYFINLAKLNISNLEGLIDIEVLNYKKNNDFSLYDLKVLVAKSFKENTDISIALIKIDNINSNKHPQILDDICKILKYHLNNDDILVPYKKDMLILVLPSTSEIDALNLCHNIVTEVTDILINDPIINKNKLNFSIGISCSNDSVYNEFNLISHAKIALNYAKLSKRKKIIAYSYMHQFNKKQQIF